MYWPELNSSLALSKNLITKSVQGPEKTIEKAERQLMQDRVREINRVIEDSNNNRDNNRARLVSLVTSTDLERCSNFIEKVREERYNRVKVRQVRKFHILYGKSRQHSNNNVRDLNTNRSSQGVNVNRLGQSNNRPNHNSQLEGIGNKSGSLTSLKLV